MSVVNDGSGTPNVHFSSTTSASVTTFTVGTGTNRFLVVHFAHNNAVSNISITWNGVALTQAYVVNNTPSGFPQYVEIWVLINPASGNNTLSASWTGSASGGLAAVEFSGADQTTGYKAADNQTGNSNGTTVLNIPTGPSDATVAFGSSAYGNWNSFTQTSIYTDNAGALNGIGTYALGGSGTNAHSLTNGNFNIAAGIHILAAVPPAFVDDGSYVSYSSSVRSTPVAVG